MTHTPSSQGGSDAVRIRPATPDEFDAAASLWYTSVLTMPDVNPSAVSLPRLRRRLYEGVRTGWHLHVAELDGRMVAMMALNPAEATIDQLFVSPEFQGKGIGPRLLLAAVENMPGRITLRTASNNHHARRVYEACGWTRVEPPEDEEDACIYEWAGKTL